MPYDSYLELCFTTNSKYCLISYRCFGGEVLEGYGMTETSCVISTTDIGDKLIGHVGSPNPSCGKALYLDFQGYNNICLYKTYAYVGRKLYEFNLVY